jgi:glycosyltransferase involved in cell wall biosynthesis
LKVLLFANTDWYLYNFRLPLAEAIRADGHDVILMSPPGRYGESLNNTGFRWIPFPLSRHGLNPFGDFLTLLRLTSRYRKESPDLVHHFTIKCVLYGSFAARLAGVDFVVNAVPGLGHLFIDNSMHSRLVRPIVKVLYRFALRSTQVIFQNPDDQRIFLEKGLVSYRNSHLIRGSGVDTMRFKPSNNKRPGKKFVLLASRLLWSKGLAEYVEAARIIRRSTENVIFMIAGESDAGNPASVPVSVIEEWRRGGDVEILGHRDDMERLLAMTDIVALPSYYGEGVPKILLEAAASGLPLIASDTPGCREIVRHGMNGLLVPARDTQALVEAIKTLISDDDLCRRFGMKSREIACEEFAQTRVLNDTLTVYKKFCRYSLPAF